MPVRLDFAALDLMDALDLAILIEDEAYERYKFFAAQLGHRFDGDAASVFHRMEEAEAKHGMELMKRREKLFGKVPMRVSAGDLFDVEAPGMGDIRSSMTAKQALDLSLTAEQRAHDFYDDALPYVTNDEVKTLFAELREEEVEHVEMVKALLARLPAAGAMEIDEDEDELPML